MSQVNFKLERLEERIAPSALGSILVGVTTGGCNPTPPCCPTAPLSVDVAIHAKANLSVGCLPLQLPKICH